MGPKLQALVNASVSFTGIPDDPTERMLAYCLLKKVGVDVTNVPALKAAAANFQGWNYEWNFNGTIYALAGQQGLTQNGPALQALVDSQWGIPNGIVDAQDVVNLTYYANLLNFGANV